MNLTLFRFQGSRCGGLVLPIRFKSAFFRTLVARVILISSAVVTFVARSAIAAGSDDAKDAYDLTEVVAVQNRAYQFNQSFGLVSAYFPSDAFNREYTLGAFYEHAMTDLFSWEILRYQYCFNQTTQTKQDIQNAGFAINAGAGGLLDYPVQIFTTGFLFTPLYYKGLMFNKHLVYGEMAFYMGGGAAIFALTGNRYLLTPGIQLRFFMSEKLALLANLRNNFYFDSHEGFTNMAEIGLSFEIKTSFFEKSSSR